MTIDISELEKKLYEDDPAFSAWRNTVPDEHWAKKDLSAVRIGYELAKRIYETRISKLEEEQRAVAASLTVLEDKLDDLERRRKNL